MTASILSQLNPEGFQHVITIEGEDGILVRLERAVRELQDRQCVPMQGLILVSLRAWQIIRKEALKDGRLSRTQDMRMGAIRNYYHGYELRANSELRSVLPPETEEEQLDLSRELKGL